YNLLKVLIDNSVQSALEGRKLAIEVEISQYQREKKSFIELSVKDNGHGMTKEELEKIKRGESFSSKGKFGSGEGLIAVRKIVLKYSGKIEVESEKGVGTQFTIVFPEDIIVSSPVGGEGDSKGPDGLGVTSTKSSGRAVLGDFEMGIINRFIEEMTAGVFEIKDILDDIEGKVKEEGVLSFSIKDDIDRLFATWLNMAELWKNIVDNRAMKNFDRIAFFITNEINPYKFYDLLNEFEGKYFSKNRGSVIISKNLMDLLISQLNEALTNDIEMGIENLKVYLARVRGLDSDMNRVTKRDRKVIEQLGDFQRKLYVVNHLMPEGRFVLNYLSRLGAPDIEDEVYEKMQEGRVFAGPF
ncbi:MAG: sensor histidine kinase, partial [Candidatus Heimdallarchaeota archaeon]|nr:sensor histidine kinase [Candidatus Heimdallarchaeota archaeon]